MFGKVPYDAVPVTTGQRLVRSFDGLNRLKQAIRRVDAFEAGKTTEPSAVSLPDPVEDKPVTKRFTVYRQLAGAEKPLAFGLNELEAKAFMVTARRMTKLQRSMEEGVEFEMAVFRVGEEA